jgi:formylmethanofuran dehydrogenase subunit C
MRCLDTREMGFPELNDCSGGSDDVEISGCLGQRFIAAGMGKRRLRLHGVPGNALGAYLNGAEIEVFGNAQDAVGDTMNAGTILVHGSIGDTAGYAMRGGKIYVRDNAGYRAGIHMKAYREHVPVMIIGGRQAPSSGSTNAAASSSSGAAHGRAAHRQQLPLHGDARRTSSSCAGRRGHPLPRAGDGPAAERRTWRRSRPG